VTGQVVTTTNVAPNQAGQWRTLRLTAANNYLRVAVDGVEVLAALDASPLPAGTLTIVGIGAGTLLVDDVSVFTSSAIPTVSPTEPFTSTAAPELPILYTESFENPQLNQWFTDIRKSIVSINNGHALHVANPNAFFPLSQGNVLNVVFREDIKLNSGIAFLGVRHSGAGYYGVAFEANGTVSLYRTDQTLASVVTTPFIPGQWRTVQFSVIENTLRVAVDNIEVLNFTDSSFLPAGTMFVAGNVEIANDFLLDNMVIQGTIAPLQTQSPTINTVSLDQHQSSAQMLNMSIPDGTAQKIVFAKYVSTWGNPEIFIMSENGDNLLQLTDNTSSEYYPDLNKFGQIAFVSDLEGDYEIYTMNYNGTNPVRRTFTNGAESSPSWSPDGTSLIFERGSQIYTLNLSGGEQLIAFGTTYKYSPKWSPTDQRIIYTDSNGQGTDIYVMSSNGDNVNRLTYTGLAWDPNWSPDSSEIVFVQSPSQSSNYNGLVVIDSSNGGFKRQIVSNSILHIYSPSWSPDDSKIVFTAGYSIMLVSSQGGSLSPLTNGNNEFTPDFGLIPVPIPTATPTIIFATNTPAITTTPSALTPAQMAQLFLVPMIDNSNPVNPITLASPIEFADRASNPPKICSRDLNPLGEANNYPLVAPEAGEVVIIDDTWSDTTLPSGQRWATNYNAGLGRFIVTRIAVSQLDDAFVRTVNLNVAGTNSSSLNLQDGGWLYIAYAHLQSIDSTILSAFNNASNANYTYAVTKGQTIGISGNSNASINHLDLTVFCVPPLINGAPRPSQFGLDSGNSPAQGDLRKWYNVFYKIFLIVNNGVPVNVNVDPVILWPTLADNSGSTYQTIVTQSCQYLPVDVH